MLKSGSSQLSYILAHWIGQNESTDLHTVGQKSGPAAEREIKKKKNLQLNEKE